MERSLSLGCSDPSPKMVTMSASRNIAVRSLIWLAALAVPVQGLPAANCGCASGKKCCQGYEQSAGCSCCKAKGQVAPCCCTAKRAVVDRSERCHATSSLDSPACNCGVDCQCGQDQQPEPVAPPVENESSQKIVGEIAAAVSPATSCQPDCPHRQHDASIQADSLTSLDRCACLCRFTL